MLKVKTRFAPSPTGLIHIGNARTALFSYLYAKANNGSFLLRIEDTDLKRSDKKHIKQICEDLSWLGINWDEGYSIDSKHTSYEQSKRGDIYKKYLNLLKQQKKIYPCFCSNETLEQKRKTQINMSKPPKYDGYCRNLENPDLAKPHTLRFLVGDKTNIEFTDLVKGKQTHKGENIGDFIVKRSSEAESFFFTNAIDDSLMGISHIIRGEDHLTNTPRQLMILDALNLTKPKYAHMALTIGFDNKPLSKRNGSMSIKELRELGFFPIALQNYFARLGHSYDLNELMSMGDLAKNFNINRIGKAPAIFDLAQLKHWQQLAINSKSDKELLDWADFEINSLVKEDERIEFIKAIRNNILFPSDTYNFAKNLFTNFALTNEIKDELLKLDNSFFLAIEHAVNNKYSFKELLAKVKKDTNLTGKNLFMPLRLILTGLKDGPQLSALYPLINKQFLLKRITRVK